MHHSFICFCAGSRTGRLANAWRLPGKRGPAVLRNTAPSTVLLDKDPECRAEVFAKCFVGRENRASSKCGSFQVEHRESLRLPTAKQ